MKMLPRLISIFVIIGITAAAFWAVKYFNIGQKPSINGTVGVNDPVSDHEQGVTDSASATPVSYKLEVVTENLEVPWSVAFPSGQRMLVTERPGRIRVIDDGSLVVKPLTTFSEVSAKDEEGLMGLTLDPSYEQNRRFYVCLTYTKSDKLWNKVVRLRDEGTTAATEQVILDETPSAQFHAGCRVKFGPDEKLYVTIGDATERNLAQDLNSLAGKILRLNSDGSIPDDNPWPGSAVYSYGHRNPQGIDWHPVSGQLWSSEHGPSGFDGPGGGDEINLIKAGANYGWPLVSHEKNQPGLEAAKLVFTPAVAPAAVLIYGGDLLPQFKNHLLFATLKGEGIYDVKLTGSQFDTVESYQKLPDVNLGRIREIVEGPDGAIYFTTSNRDGRGKPKSGDDKIYRMVPR